MYKDYTGTYTTSGSMVTIYYGNSNEMELTYESGVLVLYSGSTPELTFTKS